MSINIAQPVNLDGRVLRFTFEDCEKKTDKVSLQLDNDDLCHCSTMRRYSAG